ncbi:MAG: uncharacterized protein KVP18_004615 [Porospora cf. gigantea A]|uniref:uncharacterized protein n=1 Tax=Porospora cf. gigantea A TaxID=2853593 RepID=UPI0035596630|nr:MAG: hypothetical protein KVP18_004615 [Porospora cf. gigantea A]
MSGHGELMDEEPPYGTDLQPRDVSDFVESYRTPKISPEGPECEPPQEEPPKHPYCMPVFHEDTPVDGPRIGEFLFLVAQHFLGRFQHYNPTGSASSPSIATVHGQLKATVNTQHLHTIESLEELPAPSPLTVLKQLSEDGTLPANAHDNCIQEYKETYKLWEDHIERYGCSGMSVSDRLPLSVLRSILLFCPETIFEDLSRTSVAGDVEAVFLDLCVESHIPPAVAEKLTTYALRNRNVDLDASKLSSEIGLGFLARDSGGAQEEASGIINFQVITNDRKPLSLIQLATLKNIFSRQLPKMPREYIARLVFDRNHKSFCLVKGQRVVGGVCYRPFSERRFAEIAFLAVTSTEQVKGYGTRLMNRLKEHVKQEGIEYFLTYADNFAVGYFRKQGFTDLLSMPKERWHGCIKDYDGGTLMECYISRHVDHLGIGEMLGRQKETVRRHLTQMLFLRRGLLEGRQPSEILEDMTPEALATFDAFPTYPGLTNFEWREGTLEHIENIPGMKEIGWTLESARAHLQAEATIKAKERSMSLSEQILALVEQANKHEAAWPFKKPVSPDEAPDYHEVIKNPMDLQTVKRKAKDKQYPKPQAFLQDMMLIFDNCRFYNREDTIYYKYANTLQKFIIPKIDALILSYQNPNAYAGVL